MGGVLSTQDFSIEGSRGGTKYKYDELSHISHVNVPRTIGGPRDEYNQFEAISRD